MSVENQKEKTRVWENSSLCSETANKNAFKDFHLCLQYINFARILWTRDENPFFVQIRIWEKKFALEKYACKLEQWSEWKYT